MDSTIDTAPADVKPRSIVALTTDFGLEDPYVGIMKGVILARSPDTVIIDMTHRIPPRDVLWGCLALEGAHPYCPPSTVHLAVVDPGVGTRRRGIAVWTHRAVFVAPDNGLLSFLSEAEILQIRSLENPDLWLRPVSATFHGRDVFAPVAAHLAGAGTPASVGPVVRGIERIPMPRAIVENGRSTGEILGFDRFGNALTSLGARDLPPGARWVHLGGRKLPLGRTFSDVGPQEPLALVGSFGRLEIAVRDGSAHAILALDRGVAVVVTA